MEIIQKPSRKIQKPHDELTPREYECMKLIAFGYTLEEIASLMVVQRPTAQAYLRNLLMKLNLWDSHQVIHYCIFHNIISFIDVYYRSQEIFSERLSKEAALPLV